MQSTDVVAQFLKPREAKKYAERIADICRLLEPDEQVSLASYAEIYTVRLSGVGALTPVRLIISASNSRGTVNASYRYDEIRAVRINGTAATIIAQDQNEVWSLSKDVCTQLAKLVTAAGGRII